MTSFATAAYDFVSPGRAQIATPAVVRRTCKPPLRVLEPHQKGPSGYPAGAGRRLVFNW